MSSSHKPDPLQGSFLFDIDGYAFDTGSTLPADSQVCRITGLTCILVMLASQFSL